MVCTERQREIFSVCVCVCVSERERESVCVSVYVIVLSFAAYFLSIRAKIYCNLTHIRKNYTTKQ